MNNKKKSKMKKRIITVVVLIVVVLGAIMVYRKSDDDKFNSVNAKIGNITTYYSFSGNVAAKNRQSVVAGKILQIDEIFVIEGDQVEAGTVLLKTSDGNEIKSDIKGEIVKIYLEANAQVPSGTKIMDIIDYDSLEIIVRVDEYDFSVIEKGKEATVKINALDKEIKGTVRSMSKEGQIVSGIAVFTANIDLEKDEKVLVGMSAEVKILSNMANDVITLPMSAIQFNDRNIPYVYKTGSNGDITQHIIQTGINDGTTVEIKEGVTAGETVFYPKPGISIFPGLRISGGR